MKGIRIWMMFRLHFHYLFAVMLQGRLNCDIDLNIKISVLSKDFFGCSG